MQYNVLDLRLEPHLELGKGPERLVIAARVDGRVLVDPRDVAFNVYELCASLDGNGDFWLITCWCGDAGCAGVDGPASVSYKDGGCAGRTVLTGSRTISYVSAKPRPPPSARWPRCGMKP